MQRLDVKSPAYARLFDGADFAIVIKADAADSDLVAFWRDHEPEIEQLAQEHPAILFRGFAVRSETDFRAVRDSAIASPAPYLYRSTPRTEIERGVMTATEYPPSEEIPLHCENAYQRDWPLRLLLCCLVAPERGGQTPLADMRAVTAEIGVETMAEFARRGVRYIRNYHPGFDLDWQTVFQTEDAAEVARYCRDHDIECDWLADGVLHTEQSCQSVARHPSTGETLWFNQAHLFHPSALGDDMMADMIAIFSADRLPRDARFGDGQAIDPPMLARVRAAHRVHARSFDWRAGDVLMIDNMRVAHGRRPYSGARRVLVSMGHMASQQAPFAAER